MPDFTEQITDFMEQIIEGTSVRKIHGTDEVVKTRIYLKRDKVPSPSYPQYRAKITNENYLAGGHER